VAHNKFLGNFQLTGIAAAPRGVPKIDVTFDIDVNGIVHVSARDRATGQEQGITITGTGALSKEEIARMVQEAEAHRAEDERRRGLLECRNRADAAIHRAQRALREFPDAPEACREALGDALNELRSAVQGEDVALIRSHTEQVGVRTRELEEAARQAVSTEDKPSTQSTQDAMDAERAGGCCAGNADTEPGVGADAE